MANNSDKELLINFNRVADDANDSATFNKNKKIDEDTDDDQMLSGSFKENNKHLKTIKNDIVESENEETASSSTATGNVPEEEPIVCNGGNK